MLLDFFFQQWHLFALLVVITFLLAYPTAVPGAVRRVSVTELGRLQARENAVVIDVSTASEFADGHISQAVNLPLETLNDNLNKLNKYQQRPLILTCATGSRCNKAAALLRRTETGQKYILEGGLANWRRENMPLVKK